MKNNKNLTYNFTDHYFLFLSLIFVIVIQDIFQSWVYIYKMMYFSQYIVSENSKSSYINISHTHMAWLLLLMVITIQSWWGSYRARNIVNNCNFLQVLVFIMQPFLLYASSIILFPEKTVSFDYYKYFYENYYLVNFIAIVNIAYLLFINKFFLGTIYYSMENRYRYFSLATLSTFLILKLTLDKIFKFNIKALIKIELLIIFILFIAYFMFIKNYRMKIHDFLTLEPEEFIARITPCTCHAERLGSSITFIIIKMNKPMPIMFDAISQATRNHDEKCHYKNYIFLYIVGISGEIIINNIQKILFEKIGNSNTIKIFDNLVHECKSIKISHYEHLHQELEDGFNNLIKAVDEKFTNKFGNEDFNPQSAKLVT